MYQYHSRPCQYLYDYSMTYLIEILLRRSGHYNTIFISDAAWRGIAVIRCAIPTKCISMTKCKNCSNCSALTKAILQLCIKPSILLCFFLFDGFGIQRTRHPYRLQMIVTVVKCVIAKLAYRLHRSRYCHNKWPLIMTYWRQFECTPPLALEGIMIPIEGLKRCQN